LIDMKIEFINRQRKVKVTKEIKDTLTACVNTTLENEGVDMPATVDITFVSDRTIRGINREHRDIDRATDVLSFPMVDFEEGKLMGDIEDYADYDGTVFLGDIIISLERAAAQAEEYGHSFLREAGFLCTHSMLHLLGYDHEEDEESRKLMRRKEEEALSKIGLTR